MNEYKIRESKFFDAKLYEGITSTILSYYGSTPTQMLKAKL